MAHILFELLENAGFVKGGAINRDLIARSKRTELIDVAIQSAELCPASSVANNGSTFSHTASLSLSGGRSPCASIDCRQSKVKELAQFAAFYSDRVITNNGLFTAIGRIEKGDSDVAKQTFHDELELLLTLRPLIECGLITPITPDTNKCFHCLGKSALPLGEVAKFDNAFRRLTRKFTNEARVSLQWKKSLPVRIEIQGQDTLVEHGIAYRSIGSIGRLTRKCPKLAAKLKKDGHVILSKTQRKEFGIDAQFAHEFFDDIGFEMAVSQCLKTSVVTSRPMDIEILNDVAPCADLSRRNALIQKHMTCLVPFLGGISTKEMLKLREAEADAFIVFRQAFGKAVDEFIKDKAGRFSEKEAASVYQQVIEPELARLNQKVKTAQTSIFKKSRAGALGWAAAISAGFYFGFVESSLIAAARALGLTKVAADLASGLIATSGEDSIRDENMYFLWKVRHFAERT